MPQREHTYPEVRMLIDGEWRPGSTGKSGVVLNPATGLPIGVVPYASRHDLDTALDAARRGFEAEAVGPIRQRHLPLQSRHEAVLCACSCARYLLTIPRPDARDAATCPPPTLVSNPLAASA